MGENIPLLRATVVPPSSTPVPGVNTVHAVEPTEMTPTLVHSTSPGGSTSTPLESYFLQNMYIDHAKRFIADVKPYEVLALVPLSFVELALMKATGTVPGSVYKALVDLDSNLFYETLYKATLYYVLFTVLSAAQEYVKNALALVWRRRLATIVHDAYFRDPRRLRTVHEQLDNCDQRMTSEIEALCTTLTDIVQKVAASPFKVLFYGYLSSTYIGLSSLCLVVIFFSMSIWLQKLVALPLARDLVQLEKREGDFRSSHMRVRMASVDIGLQVERKAEEWELTRALYSVLDVQGSVVWRRTAVMAVTRVVDYSGALINYAIIALAVFWGGAGETSGPATDPSESDGGDRAAFVSNASFFTLTLIFTLTEVVDLGPAVSAMMSLLCRVYGMLDILRGKPATGHTHRVADTADSAEDGRSTSLGPRSPSSLSPRSDYDVVMTPTIFELQPYHDSSAATPPPTIMETAVLTLRGSMLRDVAGVFPSAPLSAASQVTCVMTLQPRHQLDFDAMDSSLNVFLEWEKGMIAQLGGAWCDSIDPKTGRALRDKGFSSSLGLSPSSPSRRPPPIWSEVRAFHTLLKYPIDDRNVCPMVIHPLYGSETYPVSFFTTASPQASIAALHAIGTHRSRPSVESDGAILRIENETIPCGGFDRVDELDPVNTPPLLTCINMKLEPGRHVLITGPNGSGKTTLLRYLCHRLQTHTASPPHNYSKRYMYLPQIPLIAPGRLLWQQLSYPSDTKPSEREMLDVLCQVGLPDLVPSLPHGLSTSRDWGTCLSFGEQQRLCLARVCLRKPAFALLDEATSGMDAESAAEVIREVQRVSTVVLVAHNIETLENMFDTRVDL